MLLHYYLGFDLKIRSGANLSQLPSPGQALDYAALAWVGAQSGDRPTATAASI